MKNILHITYDMRIGGTEQVIKNIIDGNDKDKFTMGIICIESPLGPFANELIAQGIIFYQLNRKAGFDLSIVKQIRKIIREQHVDTLHCHQYTPWVYGTLAAAFTNTKVIFTEHGRFYPDSSSLKRKLINPILNLFTDMITAISEATKQALVDYEYLPKDKIEVIYNGIKPLEVDPLDVKNLRLKLNIAQDTFVLGTVARFDPIKNHQMMLKAFKLVLKEYPNSKLIIVGDGEERQNIENTIKKLNIENDVILTGYIEQPKNYIALFDVFLLSSFSEGTSMTLLEAMSLGKPSIVTSVGGNPEVIFNHLLGSLAKCDDEISFYEGITKYTPLSSVISSQESKIKNTFDKNFHLKTMSELYKKIYSMI